MSRYSRKDEYYNQKRPSNNRKGDYNSSNERRDQSYQNRLKERHHSIEMRKSYPNMIKGKNCSNSYNVLYKKCTKCNAQSHHEFECELYTKYAPYNCNICNHGHHYASECIQKNVKSPSTSPYPLGKNV